MPGQFEEVVLSQEVPPPEDDFLHATDTEEEADDNIEPHEVMDDFHEGILELWYKSDPEDKHIIHYHDPKELISALLGNPAHAKDIVYRPKKVFTT